MAGTSASRRIDFATLRTIGEVAESLDLPPHVLRFWETRFKEIDPVKRAGGRRFYRESDVELVAAIRHLLYLEGYTIKGVQRILKEQGVDAVIDAVRRRLAEEEAARPPPLREMEPPPPEDTAGSPLTQAMREASLDLSEPADEPRDAFDAIASPQTQAQHIEPPAAPPIALEPVVIIRRLDETDARDLRAALAEIEECKRLLKLTQR